MSLTAICVRPGCSWNGELQPVENFTKNKNRPNGLNAYCKECRKKYNQKTKKQWQSYNKQYKQTHKEEIKEYEENNKEQRLKTQYKCNHRSAYYDTYAKQLGIYEQIRRDPEDNQFIQVKCLNCDKWFTPKNNEVKNRLASINGLKGKQGESRLYCSEGCKKVCPIYGSVWTLKNLNNPIKKPQREMQPQLRKMVLERDKHTCQICGATNCKLICHHMTSVKKNPIESADVDNCITLCYLCNKHVHSLPGCTTEDIKRCKN